MNQTLIQLDPTQPERVRWLQHSPGETPVRPSEGRLDDALSVAAGTAVYLLVPGEEVLLTATDLKLPKNKLRRAIPYALEEQLAEDVETLHFAIGQPQTQGTQVAVVRTEHMNRWLAPFRAAAITPKAIVPDVLALPHQAHSWSIGLEGERALLRYGEQQGLACPRDALTDVLEGLLQDDNLPQPEALHLWSCAGTTPPELPESLPPVTTHRCNGPLITVFAQGLQPRQTLNLLQGEFGQQTQLSRYFWAWRWAAILLGIWFLISIGNLTLQKSQLHRQQQLLQKRAEQIFRQTFPNVRRIVNPRVQMEQRLKALRGGTQMVEDRFLQLLATAGKILASEKDITLERIVYRSGQLTLQVSAKRLGQLDALKQRLRDEAKLDAELRDADSSPDKASGQIRIK